MFKSQTLEITKDQWDKVQKLFNEKNSKINDLEKECDLVHSENKHIESLYKKLKEENAANIEEIKQLKKTLLEQNHTMTAVLDKLTGVSKELEKYTDIRDVNKSCKPRVTVYDLLYSVDNSYTDNKIFKD